MSVDTPTPPWRPLDHPQYKTLMQERCDALLQSILHNETYRSIVLADPCAVHRDLFEGLTPEGFPEYAGTFRGTPGTTLEHRVIIGPSVLKPGEKFSFVPPEQVPLLMNQLMDFVGGTAASPPGDRDKKLGNLAKAFGLFGSIHPFLDGNGHVQRALFAAMAAAYGIPLSSRFRIHPRPYDILLMTMLELFTASRGGPDDISRVAEYLRFYLEGDYARPYEDFV